MLATDGTLMASPPEPATSNMPFQSVQICVHLWLISGGLLFRLLLFRIGALDDFHVGNVYRTLAFDDGAIGIILGFALMFFDEADALDNNLGLFRKNLQDLARGTTVIPGNDP